MSEVRLVVREADRDWSGVVDVGWADRAVAALSADPVTLAELQAACGRFAKRVPDRPFLAELSPGRRDEPHDAGLFVIDLAARLVVVGTAEPFLETAGQVNYHDGTSETDSWLPYRLAEEWLVTGESPRWPALADERRQRAARPLPEARAVFYGRPLLEFVARETFAAHARHGGRAGEEAVANALKEIHAAWLLTPRDDLGGACPREVALERRGHLSRDLDDQCQRWSLLGKPPPGLDASSFAYRHGGFGTHELVKHYDLVRELLWSCWRRLGELAAAPPAPADFLAGEVPRLEGVRDEWFERPDPECHGRTPRSVIDRERARLPEAMSGHDAVVDPDCPCCQMLADMPGPMFWHLDGSAMDDDFAFDLHHRTREEWEAERREWEEHAKRWEAERAQQPGEARVWSSSYSADDDGDAPPHVRLFGIGAHLSELVGDLRGNAGAPAGPPAQALIDQLNRDFGNLRELLQASEPSLAAALVQPVIDRFAESLAGVAESRPDLSAKCASLTDSLARILDPQPSESAGGPDDWETPF